MTPVRTLPVEQELVVYAGTDLIRAFRWLPDGENPQDFTGWSAYVHIGQARGESILDLSTDSNGVQLTSDGLIRLRITATQSAALTLPTLVYSLDLKNPAGILTRFLRGRVTIVRDPAPAGP